MASALGVLLAFVLVGLALAALLIFGDIIGLAVIALGASVLVLFDRLFQRWMRQWDELL